MNLSFIEVIILALAAWRLTYELCFGVWLDRVRRLVGVHYELGKHGEALERWGSNPFAEVLNCYNCASVFAGGIVVVLWWLGYKPVVMVLAVLGATALLGRWWTTQRHKAEWWL